MANIYIYICFPPPIFYHPPLFFLGFLKNDLQSTYIYMCICNLWTVCSCYSSISEIYSFGCGPNDEMLAVTRFGALHGNTSPI